EHSTDHRDEQIASPRGERDRRGDRDHLCATRWRAVWHGRARARERSDHGDGQRVEIAPQRRRRRSAHRDDERERARRVRREAAERERKPVAHDARSIAVASLSAGGRTTSRTTGAIAPATTTAVVVAPASRSTAATSAAATPTAASARCRTPSTTIAAKAA